MDVIDLGGQEAYGLAIHAGAVWAVSYQAGSLSRVDPATAKVTRTVTLRPGPATLLSTGDALWAAAYGASPADSTIYRIDPATGEAAARINPGEVCCDLSAGGGSVWAVDPRGAVVQIDPERGAVTRRITVAIDRTVVRQIPLANSMEVISLGLGFDAIWVGIRRPGYVGAVLRLDAGSGAVLDELREVQIPARIEFGFDSVWVTDSGSSSLYRISPGAIV